MSILSDVGIRHHLRKGTLGISPLPLDSAIQPASIDLTLDSWFAFPEYKRTYAGLGRAGGSFGINQTGHPDAVRPYHTGERAKEFWQKVDIHEGGSILLHPGEFVLASTREIITLSAQLCGRVEGKSTPGRWGLIVHTTAGFIDPGFDGPITLELANVGPFLYELVPGDKICQLSLHLVEPPTSKLYDGHYQHQRRPGLPV